MEKNFDVSGMTCSACSAHVQKAVEKLNGVSFVSVNLLTNSMKVGFDESAVTVGDIIAAVEKAGYEAALNEPKATGAEKVAENKKNKPDNSYIIRLSVSIFFTLALMYFSMGSMIGLPQPPFMTGVEGAAAFALTQLLLTLPVIFVNFVYFKNGFKRLFTLSPNMDSLIALGSSVSFIYGVVVLYLICYGSGVGDTELVHRYMHELYFESAAMILTLITLGKFFENLSKRRTTDAVEKLKNLVPPTAIVIRDGKETVVDSSSLRPGDIALLKAGASVPCDGEVVEGTVHINESAITGESMPRTRGVKEEVTGGTIVVGGYAKIKVTSVGEDSTLSSIIRLVQDANASKAPIAKIADKISGIFVPIVMGIALITLIVWLAIGYGAETAVTMAVSVLVISCPCALGLATPVAVMVGTGNGAQHGILFKSGEALQTLHGVKTVIFDKTGTVTRGEPSVTDFVCDGDEENLKKTIALLESKSSHPLGKAIAALAESGGEVEDFESIDGKGVSGVIGGVRYAVGNAALIEQLGIEMTDKFKIASEKAAADGKTPMYIAADKTVVGVVAVADTIKPTSALAIAELKRMGLHTVMLTGDNEATAKAVAKSVGIDEVFAGVLPDGKEEVVRRFSESGRVAFVGDGINDAPALSRASVGVAVGAGSDIALDSADVILMKSDLTDVATAVRLSRATIRNIKQNLFWAFFYNAICIPLAAGVLYPTFAIKLNPMIGAAAMSVSSLFVVGNALRLKLFKPRFGKNGKSVAEKQRLPEKPEEEKPDEKENSIAASETAAKEDITMKYVMKVEGMSCMHCVGRVKKALEAVGASAEIDLEEGKAEITVSDKVSEKTLIAAVTEAGYDVVSVTKAD